MPLEIRELIIKVNIQENNQPQDSDIENRLEKLKSEVVRECMKKILRNLEKPIMR